MVGRIGERPWPPKKATGSAYQLYSRDNYETARRRCEERQQQGGRGGGGGRRRLGRGRVRPGPSANEVRAAMSRMWREAGPDERQPFEDRAAAQKREYADRFAAWQRDAVEWDRDYARARAEWDADHKLVLDDDDNDGSAAPGPDGGGGGGGRGRRRVLSRVNTYAESEGSEVDAEG